MDVVKCPSCNGSYSIIHEECTDYYELCTCNLEDLEAFYCADCHFAFEIDVDSEEEGELELSNSILESLMNQTQLFDYTLKPTVVSKTPVVPPCRHEQLKVILSNDVPVYCSSYKIHLNDAEVADHGLYADKCWSPVHRNEFIAWPDFGIPTDLEIALDQIWEAHDRAKYYEEKVQIGCIGGHGRTGTILAIMAIIASDGQMTADDAIKFARTDYCHKAIETPMQEWFVDYAKWHWFGEEGSEPPEEPKQPVVSVGQGKKTSCSVESHFAMILDGHDNCKVFGQTCYYFEMDKHTLEKEGFSEVDKSKVLSLMEKNQLCSKESHYEMLNAGNTKCQDLGDSCETWQEHEKAWSV